MLRAAQVADGYNAPVSAGNFIDLVSRKFYDGLTIQRADGFIVQTGDPDGPVRLCLSSGWPATHQQGMLNGAGMRSCTNASPPISPSERATAAALPLLCAGDRLC